MKDIDAAASGKGHQHNIAGEESTRGRGNTSGPRERGRRKYGSSSGSVES